MDQSVICHIADLVATTPTQEKNQAVNDRLIARFALTAQNRFEQLLGSHGLGDIVGIVGTHLLAKMRELSTGLKVGDSLLKMIFIQRLPATIQQILTCHDRTIDKLAEMAYKIIDASTSQP